MPHRPAEQQDMDRMLATAYDRGAEARAELARLDALPAEQRAAMEWQAQYWRGVEKATGRASA